MKNELPPFTGFSPEIFTYFQSLEKNNNTIWFNENKHLYTDLLVNPAKAYIHEIGQFFNTLNPAIRTEPKFNQTIMRINKDMRFSKGEPYRTYFLIHFGRFKMDSEFFLFFDKHEAQIGLFINSNNEKDLFFKENLLKYTDEIQDVCERYKINGNYSLYDLKKGPELLYERFYFDEHLEYLKKHKMFLFQKIITPEELKYHSAELLSESVKIFYTLYPLYCFAISPKPLELLEDFEDRFSLD